MSSYETFYQLHHQPKPLIVANAWNVKSAQIGEKNGYNAIATTSGAISNSLGYEDGEKIPFDELLYIVKRIKSGITVPLSVDFERGYTNDLTTLTDNVQRLIDIGVVGINLEDSQGEDIYLKKLSAIKNHLTKNNQKLFINARTDGFLLKLPSPLETTLRRVRRYQDEGADGIFVTAVQDVGTIKEITSSTSLPVNLVAGPALSSIEELVQCGVRRISMAVLLYRAAYANLEKIAKEVNVKQSFTPLF